MMHCLLLFFLTFPCSWRCQAAMYAREKTIIGYTYLDLVASVREGGRTKQRIIKNLGRKEKVFDNGDLERFISSVGRYTEHALVLSVFDKGELIGMICRRIGPPLLFGRLWEATGIKPVIDGLLEDRAFEFPVERAIFTTVLHRLMVSGSDRSCEQWQQDYAIPDTKGLQRHHFCRAMAWLGEELGEDEQEDAPHVPRPVQDLVEERLFACRRDLFTDLFLVFPDTTTFYWYDHNI